MSELIEKLNQLPTFKTLGSVEHELKRVDTPKKFNPDDPEQLAAQAERLRIREGLDREAAITALRLEVVQSTGSLLTLHERLAVTAAYDPVVRKLHKDNDRRVSKRLSVAKKRGVGRFNAEHELRRAQVFGAEGWGVPSPEYTAQSIAKELGLARDFAETYGGEKVGIKLQSNSALSGTLPDPEISFPVLEPVVSGGEVIYSVPSTLSGISDITYHTEHNKTPLGPSDVTKLPRILELVDGELVANPQLNKLRQSLGLLGVNIYRDFYLDDFTKSIAPESKGWWGIMPEPAQQRRPRRRDPGIEVRYR